MIEVIHTYDNANYFLHRPDTFEEYGREHDLEQSKAIDVRIYRSLEQQNFPFKPLWLNKEDLISGRVVDLVDITSDK